MQALRADWSYWADLLRQWGLQDLAVRLLEAAGPLTVLGAQALYFLQPFVQNDALHALAQTLEDDQEMRAFVAFLQRERAP
ncbi:MAG: hypothetical protein D6770_11315 [Anaerolineae bacterium]|nr:MAG: hypothetical protein D6770_11315 [Anaerolineae bacterium]